MRSLMSHRPKSLRIGQPWSAFDQMQREMDEVFDYLPRAWMEPYGATRGLGAARSSSYEYSPQCELTETDKQYELKFDLPGMKKEDIDIELNNNRLTVSGERQEHREEKEDRDGLVRVAELSYGQFSRSFLLPEKVEEESVQARYRDGVLSIKISKAQPTHSRHININ